VAALTRDTTRASGPLARARRLAPVVPALAAEAAHARVRGVVPVDRGGPLVPLPGNSGGGAPVLAPTSVGERPADAGAVDRVAVERADAAFGAFTRAFYVEAAGRGFFTLGRGSRRLATFWTSAELIELVEDRVESSGDPAARRMIDALMRGFVLRYGRRWTRHNTFNDDMMWAVLAALRAYRITGDPGYRDLARSNFDAAFARGWSGDLGGGLWWTTGRREKNACVNGPAAIAAGLLYERLRDPAYLVASQRLFAWLRERLFEPSTGRVNDHVSSCGGQSGGGTDAGRGTLDRRAFTYNQGTFIGAADLLHRLTGDGGFRDDALLALEFAARELSPGGVLQSEGARGDGGGFKGIFARHAVSFARRHGISQYDEWISGNAQAAWERRDARGLMDQNWAAPGRRDDHDDPRAWDASSAVVLLQALASHPR
jgi:predicted alpha-1,6-mannanase (GH76 family)